MKKVMISLVCLAMGLCGCSKEEGTIKKQEVKETITYTTELDIYNQELKKVMKEYHLEDQDIIYTDSKDTVMNTIQSFIQEYSSEIIVVTSLGMIIVGTTALVITNPAIISSICTFLTELSASPTFQSVVAIVVPSAVASLKEYVETEDLKASFKEGTVLALEKVGKLF